MPECCADKFETAHQSCGMSDCCTTDVITVKLDITLMTLDIQPWQPQLAGLQYEYAVADEVSIEKENTALNILCDALSPPLSGRELHIFLHQLNIPDTAV